MIRLLRSITGLVLALTSGRGSSAPRAPYQHIIPHRNILQVPCLRQESGLITSCVPCQGSVWGPLSWLRKARAAKALLTRETQSSLGVSLVVIPEGQGGEGSKPHVRQGNVQVTVLPGH